MMDGKIRGGQREIMDGKIRSKEVDRDRQWIGWKDQRWKRWTERDNDGWKGQMWKRWTRETMDGQRW